MLLAIVFFGLLVFAALTSMISLLEVACSYFIDERQWPRRRAATVIGAGVFLFSIPSAFSMSPDMVMTSWEPGYDKNFFDTMDYLASNWMLPVASPRTSLSSPGILRLTEVTVPTSPSNLSAPNTY